jgi:membrane-anchored protein YejM (alkaline phosphatase superfamily)
VVFIAVESLNADVVRATRLPVLANFSRRCLRLTNHYSTGNCTHYGLLGLLCGTPPAFYEGHLARPRSFSPYLERFTARGYKTRVIAIPLLHFNYLGDYLPRFTEPTFEADSDWDSVAVLERDCAMPGPRFTFLFYDGTHYPYRHKPEYAGHRPEVADDFDYGAWNLYDYRRPILNRYKNCLTEFDAWLGAVLGKLDLTRTVVVVTGDHGEEVLEEGRLGHSSSFNDFQTRPPCLVYIPGVPGRDVTFLTSHADVMPSVLDALGWEPPAGAGLGKSIFRRGGPRFAVVAHQNWWKRPRRWAVITDEGKSLLEGADRESLWISSLFDRRGNQRLYRDDPDRWTANFQAVKRLRARLP